MNVDMMTLLHFVKSGDIEEVEEYVIKNGISIDSKWTDYLLLRTAVRHNHIGIAQFLIEQGCRVIKAVKSPINTLLHIAMENNSVDMITLLLENGASLTQENQDGETPLTLGIRKMLESEFVNKNILDILMENGANVNTSTKNGTTLLHIATSRKDVELVEFLIQHKADVNCAKKTTGDAPLHIAAWNGDLEIARLLLDHGADITQKNKNGKSPLHIAVKYMKKEMIDIMILSSENDLSKLLNQVDNLGISHFHAACISNNSALVLSLLERGEKVNQTVNEKSYIKWYSFHTPLSFAMISKSEEVVRVLLNFDAKVNLAFGKTRIHLAAKHMSKEIVGLILERGDDVNTCTKTGETALHIAAKHGNLDIVKMLIEHKADINCAEKQLNRTPLHYAVSKVHFEIVQVLLKEGADVHAKSSGETALDLIGRGIPSAKLCMELVENCCKIIASLLEAGCDINGTTSDGATPLCSAKRYSYASRAYALLQYNADINLLREKERKSYKLSQIFDEHKVKLKVLDLSNNIAKLKFKLNQFQDNFIREKEKKSYNLSQIFDQHNGKIKTFDIISNVINKLNFEYLSNNIAKLKIEGNQLNDNITGNDTEENCFLQKYVQQFGEHEFSDMRIERDFAQRCVAELNRMRATKVDRYTSLYSILFKHSIAMSLHASSEPFKKMLESEEFIKSFPLYGYFVRLQFKRGVTTMGLLNPAKNSLEILARLSLPDRCSESVIKFLNNKDVTNLISATEI